jgi:hypothetical protein
MENRLDALSGTPNQRRTHYLDRVKHNVNRLALTVCTLVSDSNAFALHPFFPSKTHVTTARRDRKMRKLIAVIVK